MPGDDDDTVLAQASEPPQTTVHGRERHGWQRHAFAITVAAVVLVLVLTGTTLSSMAAVGGGDGSDAGSGVVVGTPRELRTDEYLRTSPWRLGAIADPDLSFASPLSDDSALATTVTSHGVITRLVFFDSLIIELGHLTSTSMAFALLWWLPTLLLFACGPTLLTRFGVPRGLALAGVALIWFSPSVAWWSLNPIGTGLAYGVAAALAFVVAAEHLARLSGGPPAQRQRTIWRVGALIAVGGVLCARVPFAYAPWSIWLAASVLAPAAVVIVQQLGWRALRWPAVAAVAWVAMLGLGVLVENRTGLSTLNATAYPARRRETAESLDTARLFGAPFLGVLGRGHGVVNTNESELSSAWLILVVPCLLSALVVPGNVLRRARAVWWALAAVTAALLAWVTIDLPAPIGTRLPVIDLSPAYRIAQIVGIPATVLFVLTVVRMRGEAAAVRRRVAVGSVIVSAVVLAMAGSTMREFYVPGLSPTRVLVVTIVVALAIGVAIEFAPRAWSSAPLVVLAIATTAHVNPLQVGTEPLTGGEAHAVITAMQATADGRWASDTQAVDAVLMANAVPSLSGQQWVGPRPEAWRVLDPSGAAEERWNRGSAYIVLRWAVDDLAPRIANPAPDVIDVTLSPCDPALDVFGVRWVVASGPLDAPCLTPAATFTLGAHEQFVYARE